MPCFIALLVALIGALRSLIGSPARRCGADRMMFAEGRWICVAGTASEGATRCLKLRWLRWETMERGVGKGLFMVLEIEGGEWVVFLDDSNVRLHRAQVKI
jgi:hypothetical protein